MGNNCHTHVTRRTNGTKMHSAKTARQNAKVAPRYSKGHRSNSGDLAKKALVLHSTAAITHKNGPQPKPPIQSENFGVSPDTRSGGFIQN
jgi:hypothetical protein